MLYCLYSSDWSLLAPGRGGVNRQAHTDIATYRLNQPRRRLSEHICSHSKEDSGMHLSENKCKGQKVNGGKQRENVGKQSKVVLFSLYSYDWLRLALTYILIICT